jgi:hypothetical protein
MSLPTVTVTGTYDNPDGTMATGYVKFQPVVPGATGGGAIVVAAPVIAQLVGGVVNIVLINTTDVPALQYVVSEQITNCAPNSYTITPTGSTLDLSTAPRGGAPSSLYVLSSQVGAHNGVASLDNTGNVPLGQLGNVPGGGGGVASFNSRTGVVVPATGDYTATQVGADTAGAAATAQATAETFATNAVATETTRAEGAEATLTTSVNAKYTKPGSGIPATDLATAVQTNLGLAATALQVAPVTSVATKTGAVTLVEGDIANLTSDLAAKAALASPTFTGVPAAPTATALTSTTQLATTAFTTGAVATETSRAQAAEALLAPLASPALTGTPTAPTKTALTNNTDIATTAYTDTAVGVETTRATTAEGLKAPLASPALTGNPTAPTQTVGDSSTKIATDAFVATGLALAPLKANNLSDLANASTARTNLGLGTAAVLASTTWPSAAGGSASAGPTTPYQMRADTAANWTSTNPVLANHEFGYETDTKWGKLGDGSTAWTSLLYSSSPYFKSTPNARQVQWAAWTGDPGLMNSGFTPVAQVAYFCRVYADQAITCAHAYTSIITTAGIGVSGAYIGVYNASVGGSQLAITADVSTSFQTIQGVQVAITGALTSAALTFNQELYLMLLINSATTMPSFAGIRANGGNLGMTSDYRVQVASGQTTPPSVVPTLTVPGSGTYPCLGIGA